MNNWTLCEDELPKCRKVVGQSKTYVTYVSDTVLVTIEEKTKNGVQYVTDIDFMVGESEENMYWFGERIHRDNDVYEQKVIAWMPYPEPYIRK